MEGRGPGVVAERREQRAAERRGRTLGHWDSHRAAAGRWREEQSACNRWHHIAHWASPLTVAWTEPFVQIYTKFAKIFNHI